MLVTVFRLCKTVLRGASHTASLLTAALCPNEEFRVPIHKPHQNDARDVRNGVMVVISTFLSHDSVTDSPDKVYECLRQSSQCSDSSSEGVTFPGEF